MSMPTIPDIKPSISIEREDAVNIIIASIAMEELALAHILNAEGEKLQYVLGTLEGTDPGEVTICDIMEVNKSVQKTLKDVIKAEMLLQLKLEDVLDFSEDEDECQTTVVGQKIWRDGNNVAETRPPYVEIRLLRDGEVYRTVVVDSTGDGKFVFDCLPVRRDSEHKYTYQVDETVTPAGYTKTIDGFNIINTAMPGQITISGSKIWSDDNNSGGARPQEITVNLLQNGVQYLQQSVVSPPDDETTVTFDFPNVPQFDNDGNPFAYTVDENEVVSYSKTIEGFNITNTYIIEP